MSDYLVMISCFRSTQGIILHSHATGRRQAAAGGASVAETKFWLVPCGCCVLVLLPASTSAFPAFWRLLEPSRAAIVSLAALQPWGV